MISVLVRHSISEAHLLGRFSPWSWWPILLAGSIAMLGLAVGAWIMVIAIPSLVVTIIGWTLEYYRGYFAR